MFSRRKFMSIVPASALAVTSAGVALSNQPWQHNTDRDLKSPLIASPPVVQNPRANSFGCEHCSRWFGDGSR